ncbi:MAG: hypothetical protein KGL48_01290 [Sphingomonadales bacterium]|nr:hypothetical protein [Sphingomonadales bacterium]MDE2567919.1 hypothetical protein [Sphingomonadales bacterium]
MSTKQTKPQPITAHRLFPAIVALWFAALFGIGSFVVPVGLLEKLVALTGLPKLVPAAAPPLGFTARGMVALTLAGIGVIAGLVVALRLRSKPEAQAPRRRRGRDTHPDAPARRPVAASTDLADIEPLGAPAFDTTTGPVRRRALISTEDEPPAFHVHECASLPSYEDAPDMEAAPPLVAADEPVPEPASAAVQISEPVTGEDKSGALPQSAPEPVAIPGKRTFGTQELAGAVDASLSAARVERPSEPAAPFAPAPFTAAAAVAGDVAPVAGRPIEELGTVQLIERLAMAMAARRDRIAAEALAESPDARPAFIAPVAHEASEPKYRQDADPEAGPAPRLPEIEAEEEPAREAAPAANEVPSAAAPVRRPFERPVAVTPLSAAPMRPAALVPASAHEDDSEDIGEEPVQLQRFLGGGTAAKSAEISAASTGFASHDGAGRGVSVRPDDGTSFPSAGLEDDLADTGEDGDDEDNRYPSLLSLNHPMARGEFVRIEEPAPAPEAEVEPVVVFPGQGARSGARSGAPFALPPAPGRSAAHSVAAAPRPAPAANPEETDRALRAALATLQRMTNSR